MLVAVGAICSRVRQLESSSKATVMRYGKSHVAMILYKQRRSNVLLLRDRMRKSSVSLTPKGSPRER